jgi:predicted  nucleic acid-binding Zn-ribbon protein
VTNPREYESLQHEQASNNQKKIQLEERVIELWDVLALAQAALLKTKEASRDKQSRYAHQEGELAKLVDIGNQQLEEQSRVCVIKREQVRPDWLERFDDLRARIANPVVEVQNGICLGCRNKVPAQTEVRINRRELCACPLCGRILYSVSAL